MLHAIRRSILVLGVCASLLLHVLLGVILSVARSGPALEPDEPPLLIDFDVDEAPAPPEAEMPVDEQPEPEAAGEPEAEETVPEPELEDEVVEPDGLAMLDAGPPDAAAPPDATAPPDAGIADAGIADAGIADAGVADAGMDDASVADAGMDAGLDAAPADAGTILAGEAHDAAAGDQVAAALADAGPGDAGLLAGTELPGDAGGETAAAIPATAGSDTAEHGDGVIGAGGAGVPGAVGAGVPSPSDVNLLVFAPAGDVVTVLIRFERLRGTPWAAQAEAILAPMPDYRSLVGEREVTISELFDLLVISTPQPRAVTATTLVGRARISGAELRGFLDHGAAPVQWYTARGGPAGRRSRSALVVPGDPRMFAMPLPGWIVLARPQHLGVLLEPAAGDLDMAMASPADLPAWLARMPGIDALTGREQGPALMVTVQGLLPPRVQVPYLGEIDAPERFTLALEITRGGFFVRGTLLFGAEARALAFTAAAERARTQLTTGPLGKALLRRVHLYHAVRGLSFKRNGAKLAYATSISVADARDLLDRTAVEVRTFFEAQRAPVRPEAPAPEPASAPGRGPGHQ